MLHVTSLNGKYFDLFKLPKSKLTNANILCLVRFGSGRNKLVPLLIRSRDSGGQTVLSLKIMNIKREYVAMQERLLIDQTAS